MPAWILLAALLWTAAAPVARASDGTVTFGGAGIARSLRIDPSRANDGVFFLLEPSDSVAEPFSAVVFHGEMPDPGVVFEVSRKGRSGDWSDWGKASIRRRKDGRFWARTRFADARSGQLRLRARNGGVRSAHTLVLYEMETVGADSGVPGDDPGASTPPDGVAQPGASPRPPVVSREEWGARPPKNPFRAHEPVRMTQHHTAGRRPVTAEESLAEVRFIQEYHQDGRGFDDIGYHFLIDAEGRIFQGRPETAVGAHVKGFNTGNVGISFMGYHHPPFDHAVTPAQLESLRQLGRWLIAAYGIPADSYLGHRDLAQSDCPGDGLYRLLGVVRESFGREAPARVMEPREALRPPSF